MGILSNAVEKAVTRQREAIIKEAGKAGCEVLDNFDLIERASNGEGVIGGMAKSLFGGQTKIGSVQVFRMRGRGLDFVFFQPFEGMEALPGEYHVLLDGALPEALVLTFGTFNNKWKSADEELATAFNKHKAMKKLALSELSWKWQSGLTEIKLPWAVGIRPTTSGKLHLVMRNGRYGGFTTYGIGVSVFLQLCATVVDLAKGGNYQCEKDFVEPAAFAGVFAAINAAAGGQEG